AERQRARAGQGVEEGLLLDRVELQGPHVAPGHLEHAALVEADAAYAVEAGRDDAPVAAGEAPDAVVGKLLVQLALGRAAGKHFSERGFAGLHVFDAPSARLSSFRL